MPATRKITGTTAEKLVAMRKGWYQSPTVSFGHGVTGIYYASTGSYVFETKDGRNMAANRYNAENTIKLLRKKPATDA